MKLIRKRCACGCGQITNPGRRYIQHHHRIGTNLSEDVKEKISASEKGKTVSEETKKKQSLAKQGYIPWIKGRKHTKETKLKISISKIKCDPNDKYGDAWNDRGYREDLLKDYCENVNCKENYKRLNNHHIDLNKENCHPSNIITLCASCSTTLHHKLAFGKFKKNVEVSHKDYLTIIRPDRITYIHKKTRRIIAKIKRIEED